MKAVQIAAPQKMAVVEIEKPELKAGEILVKIEYVGFCGSDLNTYLGRNPMVKMPVIPGHEVGAVIDAVGPGVPKSFKKLLTRRKASRASVVVSVRLTPCHLIRCWVNTRKD